MIKIRAFLKWVVIKDTDGQMHERLSACMQQWYLSSSSRQVCSLECVAANIINERRLRLRLMVDILPFCYLMRVINLIYNATVVKRKMYEQILQNLFANSTQLKKAIVSRSDHEHFVTYAILAIASVF